VAVCIIGCGPIGLTAALLLSRHGVASLLVERRGELNTHPRSRFVDTNTMELFRELGIDQAVEATGLGPDWTAYNRWSDSLAVEPFANIPSPTFFSVPGPNSPCIPVMTAQDEVEAALMDRVSGDPNITVRFNTEATIVSQSPGDTQLTLRDTRTGACESVGAAYTIGADGPGSETRAAVGTQLEAEPRPVFSQDVIFNADLHRYVGERKGSLLYATTPQGIVIFQPLDGRRRWRCQVIVGDSQLISEEAARTRIRTALGTDDDVELAITSMRMWQPTPGCVTRFSSGRIFLAGDAAHVSVPTGGMGNNTGFAGIRNLAWKLAYVVRGLAQASILDTYETEHRPIALERIDFGVTTTNHMGQMMLGHLAGENVSEHIRATHQYADYDHVLLGFEMASDLVAAEAEPPPNESTSAPYAPVVRTGRRAPHVWVDSAQTTSVLDWFGRSYVLLLGPHCSRPAWSAALATLPPDTVPLTLQQLPDTQSTGPYRPNEAVLVRPDGIIAQRQATADGADASVFAPYLPRPAGR
jgi:2-polyprenyl-6-methoxyphenol hydroxylase-like FAD-dependent oxidoreductase